MAIDTPAKIAILGAGPIGLEAALYARFLGYEVVVFDRGGVAENVRQLGDDPLRVPFDRLHSPLAAAAIEAQDENYVPPDANALLSAAEWIECYLLPLSQTDLLADHLKLQTEVTAVEVLPPPTEEIEIGEDEAGPPNFRVVSSNAKGREATDEVHLVLDATGAKSPPWAIKSPYFHILGAKTGGGEFTFQHGLAQIRAAFAIIGDRAALDLYRGAIKLDQ